MATYHTVVRGDTLSELAVKYGTTVAKLVELNDISDPDFIVIGQVLKLTGEATKTPTNTTSRPNIKLFGLQSDTERSVYVTWTWSKDYTQHYKVIWYYDSGDSVWFVGSETDETHKQSVYTAPDNANRVKVKIKPISKTRTVNNKETAHWTADWSTEQIYTFDNKTPDNPTVPSVTVEKYKLTAEINNLDTKTDRVQFQVIKNNQTVFATGSAKVKTRYASYVFTLNPGATYKVRCRAYNGSNASEWSDYTQDYPTMPAAVSEITSCRAKSETSVYLEWPAVQTAKTYDIEYATKREYFDGSDGTTTVTGIEFTQYEKTGLETGNEYFFRIRAVNAEGTSAWSSIASVTIGKDPASPTTWSSSTTVVTGDPLNLYWVHNAEDGSSQTYAELEITINGETQVHTIKNSTDEEEKDKTSVYSINTSDYIEGTSIQWRVRTAGVTKVYGDWSIQRTVDIYAPPTLELRMTNSEGDDLEVLESFPFYIRGLAGPNTQTPIGYHLSIIANEAHEAVDSIGNVTFISADEQVYSKYFDISEDLIAEMSASNLDLENNISYTITCVVSMNSGLTAESSLEFKVAWKDLEYEPNAEIMFDEETVMVHIRPYCEDEIDGVTLAVYRREFDGTFVEIASGIPNDSYTFVADPHPALDYARYRIVATDESTGAVSYYDMPGYPIGEKAAIIQWNEDWRGFDTSNEDLMEQPTWSGSMLKLPYNIDVTDKRKIDVALIEYIGRAHPISYYGTQLGESATWTMQVPKNDTETLYALRRLSIWKGDVYVREPSGSGYWANVNVSFSQKHREVTIPVTLDITRVEGGI